MLSGSSRLHDGGVMSKITQYATMPSSSLRHNDQFVIVDVNDTSMATTGTDKNVTVGVMRGPGIFRIDDYGADPTGTNLSDAAWTACAADATSALQTNAGSMIVFGCGQYKFSVNTVSITDSRIGIQGQGRVATTIFTTGSSGVLVSALGTTANSSQGAAPISGFNLYGWNAGAGVAGIKYGDRLNGSLVDVSASGFGGTNGRGFWFQDNTQNSEGSHIVAASDNNTICYDFDQVTPSSSGGSMDYSQIYLHIGSTTVGGVNSIGMRFQNGMHCNGAYLALRGNIHNSNVALTNTLISIGNSSSDTAKIAQTHLDVQVECDSSTGTVFDIVVTGNSSSTGILHCNGIMWFPGFGGSYSTGSVGGSAVVQCAGYLSGPLFSNHGTLTALGTGNTLFTYSG